MRPEELPIDDSRGWGLHPKDLPPVPGWRERGRKSPEEPTPEECLEAEKRASERANTFVLGVRDQTFHGGKNSPAEKRSGTIPRRGYEESTEAVPEPPEPPEPPEDIVVPHLARRPPSSSNEWGHCRQLPGGSALKLA